jgi:hypothetical protein
LSLEIHGGVNIPIHESGFTEENGSPLLADEPFTSEFKCPQDKWPLTRGAIYRTKYNEMGKGEKQRRKRDGDGRRPSRR